MDDQVQNSEQLLVAGFICTGIKRIRVAQFYVLQAASTIVRQPEDHVWCEITFAVLRHWGKLHCLSKTLLFFMIIKKRYYCDKLQCQGKMIHVARSIITCVQACFFFGAQSYTYRTITTTWIMNKNVAFGLRLATFTEAIIQTTMEPDQPKRFDRCHQTI